MPDHLRTFIACKTPPGDALKAILKELAGMGRAVRPVTLEQCHITLKFLGITPEELLPNVHSALELIAKETAPFTLQLKGIGAFPSESRPSAVWAGVEGGETLGETASHLDDLLEDWGFGRDSRAYHPHLTLARIKARPPEALRALMKTHAQTEWNSEDIAELIHYKSELKPTGAVYTPLRTFPLRGTP